MEPLIFPFFESDGGVIEPGSGTTAYNCIAWSVGRVDVWWWPDSSEETVWPETVPREVTLAAFVAAFATVGYQLCENGELEVGWEKIALYALAGVPTHAARQLADGSWTSKLGRGPRVSHNTTRGVEGPLYGLVACFLRRPISTSEESQ